ncbi:MULTISPECIES: GNAT family N-acetyltransferase [Cupriavidus]|jgi:GNAT superfamily N-acetyltransferase|uniref:GNAT family N-acetyltransferase n=1 Tax=Cupriavidus campinensis TaxID=151783 RepID=A0AAE9I3A4_9BURK|nr:MULTISPECIES: GNAT family N-acetyltransferase [Cupriavidus]URF06587.1 GNAT family N-acetyltransferase [Cupriavidus campinensis]
MNNHITVRQLHSGDALECIGVLADILIDCVEGGASVSFMMPISRQTAEDFWIKVAGSVNQNERVLLVAENASGQIVGTVQLVIALPENQPHRADVAKMLVHRSARRAGVARRLLEEIDEVARANGKSVLVLDTVTDGDASRLYQRAGWQRVGDVPNYALMPDGTLCGTTFYHKQLA